MSTFSPTRRFIEMSTPSATPLGSTQWIAVLVAVALLVVGAGCGNRPRRAACEVTIDFTCDVHGRLEPCGCFMGQFGGLTRLKTVLDAETPAQSLRVDVGDAIGGRADYDLIEYQYLLRAFRQMNYDALNAGHREAQLTAAQLHDLSQTSPVPILSANLFDKASGKLIFDPFRIIERGGYRIAIVGVLDPRGLDAELGEGLEVGDMENALSSQLAALRSRADMIVLLAFTDEATLSQLAQQFYEIPIILGGKVSQPAQRIQRSNRSLIYFVTNEARALGILRLVLTDGQPPELKGNEIRLLHDLIPQDAGFRALAKDYRAEVRQARLDVDNPEKIGSDSIPGVRTTATYVGTARCVECHMEAGRIWAGSQHAHAFATLKEREADADPKCIGCHTTGFASVSGYARKFGDAQLVDVGCESCHGPGSLHTRMAEGDATISFVYRPLGAGDCEKCHHGEFSRPFRWNEFWPPIKHGEGARQDGLQSGAPVGSMNIRRLIWFLLLVFTSRAVAELPAGWNTNFTSARVVASISNRPVLVFFTASWCPPCRMMVHNDVNERGS